MTPFRYQQWLLIVTCFGLVTSVATLPTFDSMFLAAAGYSRLSSQIIAVWLAGPIGLLLWDIISLYLLGKPPSLLFRPRIVTPSIDRRLIDIVSTMSHESGVATPRLMQTAEARRGIYVHGSSREPVMIVPDQYLQLNSSTLSMLVAHELVHVKNHVDTISVATLRLKTGIANAIVFTSFVANVLQLWDAGPYLIVFLSLNVVALAPRFCFPLLIRSEYFVDRVERELHVDILLALKFGVEPVKKSILEVERIVVSTSDRPTATALLLEISRNLSVGFNRSWVQVLNPLILSLPLLRRGVSTRERLAALALVQALLDGHVAVVALRPLNRIVRVKPLMITWLFWARGLWSPFSIDFMKLKVEKVLKVWKSILDQKESVNLRNCCEITSCSLEEVMMIFITLLAAGAIDTVKKPAEFLQASLQR